MLQAMEGLPENVIAVSASGRVTGSDDAAVLVPAVERARARHRRIRFLYRIGAGFDGFTAAALWDDATVGLGTASPSSGSRSSRTSPGSARP